MHAGIVGMSEVSREFEDLLHDKAPLEAYTEWLDSMVNRCIILVIYQLSTSHIYYISQSSSVFAVSVR